MLSLILIDLSIGKFVLISSNWLLVSRFKLHRSIFLITDPKVSFLHLALDNLFFLLKRRINIYVSKCSLGRGFHHRWSISNWKMTLSQILRGLRSNINWVELRFPLRLGSLAVWVYLIHLRNRCIVIVLPFTSNFNVTFSQLGCSENWSRDTLWTICVWIANVIRILTLYRFIRVVITELEVMLLHVLTLFMLLL